jgi:2-C-methyl-D-erythritol 2,4-cyclodiphosphate synthase
VLLHAITDALLGAIAVGDIGSFFPPGDERWKNADSTIFLKLALEEIATAGYRIVNVDTTLVLSAPKIGPIASDIRERIAELMQIRPTAVGVKAKTPEGLQQDHMAEAHAIVLLEQDEDQESLSQMEAAIESSQHAEEAMSGLLAEPHGERSGRRKGTLSPFDTDDIT